MIHISKIIQIRYSDKTHNILNPERAHDTASSGVATHLHSVDTTERSVCVVVGHFDEAEVALVADGTSARGASGNSNGEAVVLVDIVGTLGDEAHLDQGAGGHALDLVVSAAVEAGRALSSGTGHVGGDSGLGGRAPFGGGRLVNERLDGTAAVVGHDVVGAADGAAAGDLGQGGAAQRHALGEVGELIVAGAALCEANVVIGGNVLGPEDGRVDLSLVIGSGAGDHSTLNTEGGSVTAGIAGDSCDLAVGGNERGGREGEDKGLDLGVHLDGYLVV